jgi:hypothetical protein
MNDPFVGMWTLNVARSRFDANHQPPNGTMTFERESDGAYLMRAHMRKADGEILAEPPQRMRPDGKPYPVPGLHGLTAVTTQPNPRTLVARATREDGSVVGEGEYVVSEDGGSLTATTAGFDTQLRQFKIETSWDRA